MSEGLLASRRSRTVGHSLCAWCWGGEVSAPSPILVNLSFNSQTKDLKLLSCVFQVVLCGGSARIPKLQQLIKDIFPVVELLNSIPPDEVIPIGAAIEAGILLGKENTLLEEDALIECSAKDILLKVRLNLEY